MIGSVLFRRGDVGCCLSSVQEVRCIRRIGSPLIGGIFHRQMIVLLCDRYHFSCWQGERERGDGDGVRAGSGVEGEDVASGDLMIMIICLLLFVPSSLLMKERSGLLGEKALGRGQERSAGQTAGASNKLTH